LCSWREDIDFTVEEKAFFTPIDMKSFNDLPQNLIIELEERDDCSLDEESFDEEDNDDSDEDFEEELSDEEQDLDFETFDE